MSTRPITPKLRDSQGRYQRPALPVTGPERGFRGYYRGADPVRGAKLLRKPEEVAIAVVRSAYKIADQQLDRGSRLVQRLKSAGDDAVGEASDLQSLDAIERLSLKLVTTTAEWLEATAAEPGSPLKRLAKAQYRLFGSLLGIADEADDEKPAARPVGRDHRGAHATGAAEPSSAASAKPIPTAAKPPLRPTIVLDGIKRPVRLVSYDMDAPLPARGYDCPFYATLAPGGTPMAGHLDVAADGTHRLTVTVRVDCPSGHWSAAVCDDANVQCGVVELTL